MLSGELDKSGGAHSPFPETFAGLAHSAPFCDAVFLRAKFPWRKGGQNEATGLPCPKTRGHTCSQNVLTCKQHSRDWRRLPPTTLDTQPHQCQGLPWLSRPGPSGPPPPPPSSRLFGRGQVPICSNVFLKQSASLPRGERSPQFVSDPPQKCLAWRPCWQRLGRNQFFLTGSRTVIPLDMGNFSEKDRRDRSVPSAAAWAGTGPKSDTWTLQAPLVALKAASVPWATVRLQAGPKDVNTESGPRRPL